MTSDMDALAIAMRTLSMDAVQKAESGHPGTPMALAPVAYGRLDEHFHAPDGVAEHVAGRIGEPG
ncbi:MAG: hypothetical protein M3350_11455, partial [Actinomycetota bacterium]|nr:hypothetical protein [Actinomycetota bacterium]